MNNFHRLQHRLHIICHHPAFHRAAQGSHLAYLCAALTELKWFHSFTIAGLLLFAIIELWEHE